MERARRIELRYSDRRSDAQPIGHTREICGADGDNRNLFSGLEARGTPYVPRPLDTYSIVKDRGLDRHTYSFLLSEESKSDNASSWPIKQKKRAAIFGGRPFLEIGCYSKTVRSPRARRHH